MKSPAGKFVILLSLLLLLLAVVLRAEPNVPGVERPAVKAVVIPCKDMIDDGLFKSIRRRTQEALDSGAEYLIYEIGTYGGLLKSADDISKYLILEVGKKAHTVAYITTEAISAGAMISVSCQDIIMLENTTIGDCAPITIGGKLEGVEREKAESFTRVAFDRAAKANNYPQALLRAMVTMGIEVYKIKNLQTGEKEYFEGDMLPMDPNTYDIDNKELVISDKKILSWTASEAHEHGIARQVVEGMDGVLEFLQSRDGVEFSGKPKILKTNWSEDMVRWLNSPAVMGVLIMLAMLGIYVELNTPGVGLPGLVAVICFAIIIGSKHLIGLANWVEVAVFILGIVLLLVEFLVIPGFGITGAAGIVCILLGLFGMLVKNKPDEFPWPQTTIDWRIFTDGALGLSLGFLGFLILAWLMAKHLPKFQAMSGLVLLPSVAKKGDETQISMTAPLQTETIQVKVDDIGVVVSPLRPTGKVKFGQAIVDVICQAEFLDKGTEVEIIEIHGNRVIVKKVNS